MLLGCNVHHLIGTCAVITPLIKLHRKGIQGKADDAGDYSNYSVGSDSHRSGSK